MVFRGKGKAMMAGPEMLMRVLSRLFGGGNPFLSLLHKRYYRSVRSLGGKSKMEWYVTVINNILMWGRHT